MKAQPLLCPLNYASPPSKGVFLPDILVADLEVDPSDERSTVRLSDLLGRPVKAERRELGELGDLVANFAGEGYPRITGLLIRNDDKELFVSAKLFSDLSAQVLSAQAPPDYRPQPFERRPGELLLKRDVVGRKLIYIGKENHPALIKAADLEISRAEDRGYFLVTGVFVARPRLLLKVLPFARRDSLLRIDFEDVEIFKGHVPTSLLKLRYRKLAKIHPSELADLVESATSDEAEEILEAVSENRGLEADVFEELDEERQARLVARMTDEEVAELLNNMAPDDAADLLGEIEPERRQAVLARISPHRRLVLKQLLGFNPESAGGLMTTELVRVGPDEPVATVIERLAAAARALPLALSGTAFVVGEEGQLVGQAPLIKLVSSEPQVAVREVMDAPGPTVRASADLSEIVVLMSDFNLYSLPVTDEDGVLLGVITVDDVLERLIPENWRRRMQALSEG